jgi:hypothetical protein
MSRNSGNVTAELRLDIAIDIANQSHRWLAHERPRRGSQP